jgi:hypothetical protein
MIADTPTGSARGNRGDIGMGTVVLDSDHKTSATMRRTGKALDIYRNYEKMIAQ